jgi:anti-anti-sigma factor
MVQVSDQTTAVNVLGYLSSQFMITTGPGDVLRLHGELDLASAPRLEAALGARSLRDCQELVIDLSDLAFAGCAGLAEHHRRRAAHSGLLLVAPTDGLRRILSVTGIDAVLNIRPADVTAA